MLKRIKKLIGKPAPPATPPDVRAMATAIEPLVENLVAGLFQQHAARLLSEDITYIVPAVWGASKEGPLDNAQREIAGQMAEMLPKLLAVLELGELTAQQEFALGYLVRSLVVAKITYLIEGTRGMILRGEHPRAQDQGVFGDMETVGTA